MGGATKIIFYSLEHRMHINNFYENT